VRYVFNPIEVRRGYSGHEDGRHALTRLGVACVTGLGSLTGWVSGGDIAIPPFLKCTQKYGGNSGELSVALSHQTGMYLLCFLNGRVIVSTGLRYALNPGTVNSYFKAPFAIKPHPVCEPAAKLRSESLPPPLT
jgi:hypothetical protein